MDPLEALRSGIAKGKTIERKDGSIVIGTHAFPDKTYTCMKKLNAYEKHENKKETSYYTLDCVFFFWTVFSENADTDIGTYIEKCASNGVDVVSFPQKQALLSYLNGKEESCIYCDTKAPFRYVKPQYAGSSTSGATTVGQSSGDKAPTIGIETYKRMRTIIGNEKIYKTRSKMINLEGSSSFAEAVYNYLTVLIQIDLLRRDEKNAVKHDEDWKGRMSTLCFQFLISRCQ